VTEVRDGIDQLTARAASPEIAEAMIRKMAWYDAYLGRGGVDRSANTTPGNKRGGLSNIVEKAMGSILEPVPCQKAGVVSPGNRVGRIGLNYAATPPRRYAATPPRRHAATPASDFICGTLQVAAASICRSSRPDAERPTAWRRCQ
jgi:galactarate dehydratase